MDTKTILIVDDEKPIVALLDEFFRGHLGYNTLYAHNYEEGLRLATENHIDLPILDFYINGYQKSPTGVDLAKSLRANQFNGLVVLLTGTAGPASNESEGLQNFIIVPKPIPLAKLYKDIVRPALNPVTLQP